MSHDTEEHSPVVVYATHEQAAVETLAESGVGMKRLSIIGKEFHSESVRWAATPQVTG